ncbi:Aldo/keto reductase [Panus rudis PR-1116 ss-1]|nr:Aldo/keto reductase [Panus rudis PR-1116 ss-1]
MSPNLPTRKIGDIPVPAIGYGVLRLATPPGGIAKPEEERLKVLDEVYASGVTFWDTADVYGDNEDLIGKWFRRTGKRDEIFLATKFGLGSGTPGRPVRGDPEYVHEALNKSLGRLGVDSVDLYYLHRPDPTVPIEVCLHPPLISIHHLSPSFPLPTVDCWCNGRTCQVSYRMLRFSSQQVWFMLLRAGKVKHLGLSECSVDTLRRAHAVHPITAVQVEYSPFALDIEEDSNGLLKAARELGVTVVVYSPLGRGLLTGRYRSPDDFEEGDVRRMIPKFSKENFPKILKLVDSLKSIGERYNATAGQVTLAWILEQGNDIIPIPGTTNIANLKENLGTLNIKLTPAELQEIREIAVRVGAVEGDRYPPGHQQLVFGDTPPLKR